MNGPRMQTRRKTQRPKRGDSSSPAPAVSPIPSFVQTSTKPLFGLDNLSDDLLAHILNMVVWARVSPLEQTRSYLWQGVQGLAAIRRCKDLRLVCKRFDKIVRAHVKALLVFGRNNVQRPPFYTDETWAEIIEGLEENPWLSVQAIMLREFFDRTAVNAWQPLSEPAMTNMVTTTVVFLDLTGSKPLPAPSTALAERRRSAYISKCFHLSQGVLTGPAIDISCLKDAPVLERLMLNYRRVKGASAMLTAPRLKHVELEYAAVVDADIPPPANWLSPVKGLTFEFSSIDSLLFLPACPYLEEASLNYCTRLSSLDGLNCPALERLSVNHTYVTSLDALHLSPALTEFYKKEDPFMVTVDLSLQCLAGLSNLQTLQMPFALLPDLTPLSCLPCLARIDMFLATTGKEASLADCTALREIVLAEDPAIKYNQADKGEWPQLRELRPDIKFVLQGPDTHLFP